MTWGTPNKKQEEKTAASPSHSTLLTTPTHSFAYSPHSTPTFAPPKPEDELLKLVEASGESSRLRVKADANYQAALSAKLTNFAEKVNSADRNGSSILDVQKGIFTLLQGAAYRTYIVTFAADSVTENPDRSLPYTFAHFTKFVRAVVELYKSLDIVEVACHAELDSLAQCVADQEALIRAQVAGWTHEKQVAWEKEEAALNAIALPPTEAETKRAQEAAEGLTHFLSRAEQHTRNMFSEGFSKMFHLAQPKSFLDHRFRVLLDSTADESLNGCVCSVRFWYEVFMPKLLFACSIQHQSDLTPPSESSLDSWFQKQSKEKRFSFYGKDLEQQWDGCDYKLKLALSRAWRLMVFYLNGVQKQREKAAGHGEGDLTQYVGFMDVYLGKSYMQAAAMRLSFPALLGTNTWLWQHTAAERALQLRCNQAKVDHIIASFKVYMQALVHCYPCLYRRHLLNTAIIPGVERHLYPLEFLFVGWEPTPDNPRGQVDLAQRLSYIKDPQTLSLFAWKLHNAVNVSIRKEEEWYQEGVEVVYTSRYWPNVDAELYRATTHSGLVAASRMRMMVDLLKTAKELASLRHAILNVQPSEMESLMGQVRPLLAALDRKILASEFLQEAFGYQAGLVDPEPDPQEALAAQEAIRKHDFTLN